MTVYAASLLTRASEALQDTSYVRWTEAELLRYLYDGVQALITARPDMSTTTAAFTPAVGARQTLPSEAVALVDVLNNTATNKRAVTKVSQPLMEATNRDWMSATPADTAVNYMYDLRTPRTWYIYPPATGGGSVDIVYSVFPAETTSRVGTYDLSSQWQTPLLAYVLGRAYAKDAEYGGNMALSTTYMSAFAKDIEGQATTTAAISPKS